MTWPNIRKGLWMLVELSALILWLLFVVPILVVFGLEEEKYLW